MEDIVDTNNTVETPGQPIGEGDEVQDCGAAQPEEQQMAEDIIDNVGPVDDTPETVDSNPDEPFAVWSDIPMHRAIFEGASNKLEVVAGTSTPNGPSSDSQTILMLHDLGHTTIQSMRVMTSESDKYAPCGVLMVLGGESEARTLADSLEFAAKIIRQQLAAKAEQV